MSKNIRSKVVRESLLDYNTLANSLKENTESAVKNLLNEAVRDTYAKLLNEGDEDYEEEEVEDTNSDITTDDAEGGEDIADDGMEADSEDDGLETETGDELPVETGAEDEGGADDEEWAEFDKYKVSDDEYDFSNAEDEEIVKVYKLMKNDDQILVHKDDNGNVNIQDNETGAEYLINLGDNGEATGVAASEPGDDEEILNDDEGADDFSGDGFETEFEVETDNDNNFEGEDENEDFEDEDELDNNIEDDMNESTERMFELVLEYDSNVGYTDNYQKKDVMTNPGMSEPGKNVNDWDAGVPKGSSKPWSGKTGKKSENQPFDGKKGKKVEENSENECGDTEMPVEESIHTVTQNGPQRRSTTTSQAPDTSRSEKVGRNLRLAKIPGQKKGTGEAAYTGVSESLAKRVNKTIEENKALKKTLNTVMSSLKEAAVTNCNLAQIVKLISENSTTQEEKREIIGKFAKQAKTVEASKALYESINEDLKKVKKMNLTEDKNLSVESSKKINETTIYKSQDVMESLDLMHRMMK